MMDTLNGETANTPDTMLLLMIFPPSVARDLGTTVMMLPLVVLTQVAPPLDADILAPILGLTVGLVYVACVAAQVDATLGSFTLLETSHEQRLSDCQNTLSGSEDQIDEQWVWTLTCGLCDQLGGHDGAIAADDHNGRRAAAGQSHRGRFGQDFTGLHLLSDYLHPWRCKMHRFRQSDCCTGYKLRGEIYQTRQHTIEIYCKCKRLKRKSA